MYDTSSFRKNLKIEIDGVPYIIVEAKHVKPGKGVAFVKTRYKSLKTGAVFEKNFRSGDKVDKPNFEQLKMQFLYRDDDFWVFMDTTSYEQISLAPESVGDDKDWIKENFVVEILFHNEQPIAIELPNFVALEVVKTDPGVKGDTASGGTKPATLETGAVINVPLYLNQNEIVKVDTRTGTYVERVKK